MKKYIFATLVGLICVSPYILPVFSVSYRGIPFLYQDNEDVYLSRINEVIEGHYSIASPVFYEYKDANNAQQPMGEWIYGFLGKIIPVKHLVIITKFAFPALLFLLIFNLVFRLNDKKDEYVALFTATACILGFDMLRVSFLKEILSGDVGFHLSIWTRLVNPITGALFLFLFLNVILTIYEQRKWKHTIFAGIILGCMTGYYFSFVLACVILGLLCIYLFYKKDFDLLKKFISVFIFGFILNIHYAWSLIHLSGAEALKSGMIPTHMPLQNKILGGVVLVLAATYRKLRHSKIWFVGSIFTIASFIAMNIHVITGKAIWPQHFVQYTNLLSIISVSLILSTWLKKTFLFGTLLIFTLAIFIIPSYKDKLDDFSNKQRFAGVFEWLNKTEGDCVVLPYEKSARIAWTIPAYTKCDTYSSPYVFSSVPEDRIINNFLTMMYIRGGDFTTDDMREYLFRDWRDMFAHQPDAWLESITDREDMDIYFTNLNKKIKDEYVDFKFGEKYRMDYIVWDLVNASSTDPRKNKNIKQVFEENGIFIFKI